MESTNEHKQATDMKKATLRLLISVAFCTLLLQNIQCMGESTKEIWKPVVGWEELYLVSDTGHVKSLRKSILLKSSSVNGYRQVILCLKGKMYSGIVHRLVAKAFIPNPENKSEVNHINGIKDDNRVSNLEWCTPRENMIHSYKELARVPVHGPTHNKAKLTEDQVREIRRKYIPRKYSCAKLGAEYGVDGSAIHLIIKGRNWKYTC